MKQQNSINTVFWIFNIMLLLFGVCTLIFSTFQIVVYLYALCAISIFYGVAKTTNFLFDNYKTTILRYDFAIGLFSIFAGAVCMIQTELMISLIAYIMLFATIFNVLAKVQNTIDLLRAKSSLWWWVILASAILVGLVYYILQQIQNQTPLSSKLLGAICTLNAITNIVVAIFINHVVNTFNKTEKETNSELKKPLHETQEFELVEIKKINSDMLNIEPELHDEIPPSTDDVIRPTQEELSGENRKNRQTESESEELKRIVAQDEQSEKLAQAQQIETIENKDEES